MLARLGLVENQARSHAATSACGALVARPSATWASEQPRLEVTPRVLEALEDERRRGRAPRRRRSRRVERDHRQEPLAAGLAAGVLELAEARAAASALAPAPAKSTARWSAWARVTSHWAMPRR